MESKKFRLNADDLNKFLHNSLVFFAPLALIYLGSIAGNFQDGVSLSDFALVPATQGALILYLLNVATDFFKKLTGGSK